MLTSVLLLHPPHSQQDPAEQAEDHRPVPAHREDPGEHQGRGQHGDADADQEAEGVLAPAEDRLCESDAVTQWGHSEGGAVIEYSRLSSLLVMPSFLVQVNYDEKIGC